MNAFEEGSRKTIPAVLIYAFSEDKVLMLHRDAQGEKGRLDYHSGKWNGLGGKCEADESSIETARREFREESGVALEAERFKPLGTLQFPNFKAHKNEDWLVFVYAVDFPASMLDAVIPGCDEGSLHWVPTQDLLKLQLWEGDRHFIPYVVRREPFTGAIWYEGQRVARHWVQAF